MLFCYSSPNGLRQAKFFLLTTFYITYYWNTVMLNSLMLCLRVEVNCCPRDPLAHKAQNIDYLALYTRCLPTPDLNKNGNNVMWCL